MCTFYKSHLSLRWKRMWGTVTVGGGEVQCPVLAAPALPCASRVREVPWKRAVWDLSACYKGYVLVFSSWKRSSRSLVCSSLESSLQIFSLLQFGKQPGSDSSGCFSGIYCCPPPSVQAVPPVVLGFVQSQCASFPLLLFGKCTLLVLHVLPRWAEPWDAWSTSWPGILAPCPCLE